MPQSCFSSPTNTHTTGLGQRSEGTSARSSGVNVASLQTPSRQQLVDKAAANVVLCCGGPEVLRQHVPPTRPAAVCCGAFVSELQYETVEACLFPDPCWSLNSLRLHCCSLQLLSPAPCSPEASRTDTRSWALYSTEDCMWSGNVKHILQPRDDLSGVFVQR